MIVERNIGTIISDNDESYLSLLEAVVSSTDEYSRLIINKFPSTFTFRIIPSEGIYLNNIVNEVLKLHTMLGIKVDMSKSMKTSGIFEFQIKIIKNYGQNSKKESKHR